MSVPEPQRHRWRFRRKMLASAVAGLAVVFVAALLWAVPLIWPPRTVWVRRVGIPGTPGRTRLIARFAPEDAPNAAVDEPAPEWDAFDHAEGTLHLHRQNTGALRDRWAEWLADTLGVDYCFSYSMRTENHEDPTEEHPPFRVTEWSEATRLPQPERKRPPEQEDEDAGD